MYNEESHISKKLRRQDKYYARAKIFFIIILIIIILATLAGLGKMNYDILTTGKLGYKIGVIAIDIIIICFFSGVYFYNKSNEY